MADDLIQARLDKLARLRELGLEPYQDQFPVSHSLQMALTEPDGTAVRVAGRLMTIRKFGKLAFAHLQDGSGRGQVSFQLGVLPPEEMERVKKLLDVGDSLGIEGELWTTRKGERTVQTHRLELLSKALRPLPEKWHGLKDDEARSRRRYLDLIANDETRERFVLRSKVISFIRRFLEANDFLEVETPILQVASSGAAAKPFVTHHAALDRELFLRVAPETYLKRLIVGGFERVYELGKNFRNEGIDASHLQEFTMLEWYAAYWNYRDNMRFVQELLQSVVEEFCGGTEIRFRGQLLDFGGDWPEISYVEAVEEETGINVLEHPTRDSLAAEVKAKIADLDVTAYPSTPALVDALYKATVRPKLQQPCFLTHHPAELVPLARRSSSDPRVLDMFQVLVGSWEIVKSYSELIDPLEQYQRMSAQRQYREAGDEETMMTELDYIECMEYGMPPNSGLGLGIDRLIALLTGSETLRSVVFFPSMREERREEPLVVESLAEAEAEAVPTAEA